MYFIENFDLLIEVNQPIENSPEEMSPDQPPPVEFENIKKYVLFSRLKEIKLKLEISNIDRKDPNILNLFEFIDLILLFYNTFTYDQSKTLINNVLEMTSSILKIKLTPQDQNASPPTEPVPNPEEQQMQQQMQQQQMQMQQQQIQQQNRSAAQTANNANK